jgi:type I restriction enzyme S subunit
MTHSNIHKLPVVRLGDVCSFKSGNSLPDGQEFLEQEHGFLLLKVSDLNRTENIPVIRTAGLWSQIPVMESTSSKPGAIILPKRGGAIATNKKRILGRPAALDPNLMGVEPDTSRIDSLYLYYWFQQFDLTKITSGSAVPQLNKQDLFPLKIPLPPLEGQRRIAAILDKADAVRRKRKEAIALTEELLRSAFLEMFGDPVLNPKGWSQRQLGELLSIVSGQVDPQAHPYIDMPHIGGENIESNTGHLSGVQTPRELGLKSGKYLFEPTDVLYSKIRPYLNKVVIPGFTGVCSADIYPLRVDESQLDQRYLVYLLRSKIFLTYAEKHSARTNIPKVNRPALLKFTLPHPPLALQKEFSVIYSRVECVRNRFESAVENDLFNALLQRAFRGEL